MDFSFSADQRLFQDNLRAFLLKEVPPERLRELWQSPGGRCQRLWQQLAELGLHLLTVPEPYGGMGLQMVDGVLLAQECGYAALAEPWVDTALIGVPLLAALDEARAPLKSHWLTRIAEGHMRLAVAQPGQVLVSDAHVADLLLLAHGDQVHALQPAEVRLLRNASMDPGRQLFEVHWTPSAANCVADAAQGRQLWARAFNRGALGTAAQLLGLARRMVDLAVDYTFERKQFGQPVGSFQAVKHLMANVAVQIEFAKGPLFRAAWVLDQGAASGDVEVSHAKLACAEAALLAAKNAIQAHGAMGYTWEVDLQLFMKRAWALDKVWGDRGLHKARVRQALFDPQAPLGAGQTFA